MDESRVALSVSTSLDKDMHSSIMKIEKMLKKLIQRLLEWSLMERDCELIGMLERRRSQDHLFREADLLASWPIDENITIELEEEEIEEVVVDDTEKEDLIDPPDDLDLDPDLHDTEIDINQVLYVYSIQEWVGLYW